MKRPEVEVKIQGSLVINIANRIVGPNQAESVTVWVSWTAQLPLSNNKNNNNLETTTATTNRHWTACKSQTVYGYDQIPNCLHVECREAVWWI